MEVHGNENESNLSVITELVKLTNSIGGANNINLGDGVERLQVLPYARDVANNQTRELRCDTNGRLECSVDALEVTAETINLSTDTLESLIGTTNTKLNGGLPTALTGSGNLKVSIQEQTSTTLPTGAATEAKQDVIETTLTSIEGTLLDLEGLQTSILVDTGVIKGDTTSIDGKITACNTGAVVISSSALPTGASTSALQTSLNTKIDTIDGVLDNILVDTGVIKGDTTSIDGKITACNTGAVTVSSSVLPTGGSTSALQTSLNTKIDTIDGVLDNILVDTGVIKGDTTSIDGKITACNTGAVTVSSSVLPTGGSTSALQTSLNSKIDTIDGVLDNILVDTGVIKGDTTSIDGKITACNTGAVTISSSVLPTGGSTSALQTSLNSKIDTIDGVLDTISSNTSSNLTKLDVIKDDTTSIDGKITACNTGAVTISSSALPTGAATSALQGGGLPAALTGSGNLKISLEEGSITANDTTTHGKLDTLETTLTAIETDAAALEVLQTSIDGKLPASLTGSGNLKVSLEEGSITANDTTTHGKLDTLETTLTAIETDAAALEVLQTATNSKLDNVVTAVQLLDDTVGTDDSATPTKSILVGGRVDTTPRTLDNGDIGAISITTAGDVMTDQYHQTETTVTLRDNVSVSAGDLTSVVDLGAALKNKHITIYGSTTTAAAKFYIQFGPTTTVADHYIVDATESVLKQKGSSGVYHYVMSLRDIPERYVSVYCDVTGAAVYQFAVVSR